MPPPDTEHARLLVLIPAFNESARIANVVSDVSALSLPVPFDILVVDDGSTDATPHAARSMGARVVSLTHNLGYGCALRAGYLYATAGNYSTLIQLDGDGQHGTESIPALLDPVLTNNADIAIGSRFGGLSTYQMPASRRAGQRLFSFLLRNLVQLRVTDVTSGFQCLNRRAIALYASDEFPSDYPDANVLLWSALRGMRITEVPAVFRSNSSGKSMHRGLVRPLFYVYSMIFSMMLVYLANRNDTRTKDGT